MNMLPKPGIEPGTFRSSVWRSQLSYFGLFVVNFHVEIALFTENANTKKKW